MVYDPIIGKLTLWIGLATALVLGIVAYLVATGVWPIAGLGQFARRRFQRGSIHRSQRRLSSGRTDRSVDWNW